MIEEGARVKLRPGSMLAQRHPEMLTAVGVDGSVVHGAAWRTPGAGQRERARDVSMHIRFRDLNLVALNVPAEDVEAIDRLDPELHIVL